MFTGLVCAIIIRNMPADDFDFQPSTLPPEAYRFSFYMERYGLNKAMAKRAAKRTQEEKIFLSGAYQANLTALLCPPPFGAGVWISIKRVDKSVIVDRSVLGTAMRKLLPGYHGYELFPSPQRLVDTSNQYHIWCFKGMSFFEHIRPTERALEPQTSAFELDGLDPGDAPGVVELRPPSGLALEKGDWRLLQEFKERCFPGKEAAQLHAATPAHPMNGRILVLTNAQAVWPFGFKDRMVTDAEQAKVVGARQRAL